MTHDQYEQLPLEEKEHFSRCAKCGQFVDKRELRDVILSTFPYAVKAHEGRSGIPRWFSDRTASTVTVPPVTGVLIRARKVPDTLPARYSVVVFAGTVIVLNALQMVGEPDSNGVAAIGVFPGQHSIVTAPADTEPLPVIRNMVNLGSEKNWFTPTPVVAAF